MKYGKSKYLAERAVMEAVKSAEIEAVILRPCWFYGPRQPERQTRFFQMIKKGDPVLFGDGSNLRSVSYIDNIVQGIILALETDGINGETYWIADDRPYTTLELYRTIADLLGVKELKPKKIPGWSSWVFEQIDAVLQCVGLYVKEIHVAGEMSRNIACSVEKAKKELGYKPDISLEEGMRRSIEWCRGNGEDI
jgi:nucleoside-diphosphate-sugar epimerase